MVLPGNPGGEELAYRLSEYGYQVVYQTDKPCLADFNLQGYRAPFEEAADCGPGYGGLSPPFWKVRARNLKKHNAVIASV